MPQDRHISIVIPTHNRVKSLEHLLGCLAAQKYPLQLMEVVVVADGCHDGTGAFLRQFQAPYRFQFLEEGGNGPAIARNAGAAVATGDLLLFIDDDIEPSAGLVAAHVRAHAADNSVVIGYLPYQSPKFTGFYIAKLRAWWENKFYSMRMKGYRYTYEDLLSGNFSLPTALFTRLRGFDANFRCREDYELGIRLMEAGATFVFSTDAWGKHLDEATDFVRSLWRKQQEGKADVQLARLYPHLLPTLRLNGFAPPYNRAREVLLQLVYKTPWLSSLLVLLLQKWVVVLERFRLRNQWQHVGVRLQQYWYLKGVASELPKLQQLRQFLRQAGEAPVPTDEVTLDLKKGLEAAEELLDAARPASARILYGDLYIGHIPYMPGAERLRGAHLRPYLATRLAYPLSHAMALDAVTTSRSNVPAARLQPVSEL